MLKFTLKLCLIYQSILSSFFDFLTSFVWHGEIVAPKKKSPKKFTRKGVLKDS